MRVLSGGIYQSGSVLCIALGGWGQGSRLGVWAF